MPASCDGSCGSAADAEVTSRGPPLSGSRLVREWSADAGLDARVWVIDETVDTGTLERLGEARVAAAAIGCQVGALIVSPGEPNGSRLAAGGADLTLHARVPARGARTFAAAVADLLLSVRPRLVLAAGDGPRRDRAARLATRTGWDVISPALAVRPGSGRVSITALDELGRRVREVAVPADGCAVAVFRPGVADALLPDPGHPAVEFATDREMENECERTERVVTVDPATADIRHVDRLIAGGNGLGGKDGFDRLRRIAALMGAGVAASRMAVDRGWIEPDRQVGQTGKTVAPELYLACGISGAGHHLEGMTASRHIVAINTDPAAPIFRVAHLGLVADLAQVLDEFDRLLQADSRPEGG